MSFGRAVVIVSGASRGIGAEICAQVSTKVGPGSVVLGIARSADKLAETAASVTKQVGVKFIPLVMDLSSPDFNKFEATLTEAIGTASTSGPCKSIVMVHNAGSLGDLKYLRDYNDMAAVTAYFDFNLSSLYPMNHVFLKGARALQSKCTSLKIKIVNISSLSGIQAFRTWGLYCTSKAARDMMFKVLAAEETDVDVLSYSPGPVDTDMQASTRATPDEKLREMFTSLKDNDGILTTQQTVTKLMSLMEGESYKSGDHVDYFD